jgi:hypothetical protein
MAAPVFSMGMPGWSDNLLVCADSVEVAHRPSTRLNNGYSDYLSVWEDCRSPTPRRSSFTHLDFVAKSVERVNNRIRFCFVLDLPPLATGVQAWRIDERREETGENTCGFLEVGFSHVDGHIKKKKKKQAKGFPRGSRSAYAHDAPHETFEMPISRMMRRTL